MDDLLKELTSLLQQEIGLYRSYLTLLHKERDTLVHLKLNDLLATLQEKRVMIRDAERLEEARQTVTRGIADHLKLSPDNVKLLVIAKRVSEPYASQFTDYYSKLKSLILAVKEANVMISGMANQSLKNTRDLLQFLKFVSSKERSTYVKNGTLKQESTRGRYLSQAI